MGVGGLFLFPFSCSNKIAWQLLEVYDTPQHSTSFSSYSIYSYVCHCLMIYSLLNHIRVLCNLIKMLKIVLFPSLTLSIMSCHHLTHPILPPHPPFSFILWCFFTIFPFFHISLIKFHLWLKLSYWRNI